MVSITNAPRASFAQPFCSFNNLLREDLKKAMVATNDATKESTAKKMTQFAPEKVFTVILHYYLIDALTFFALAFASSLYFEGHLSRIFLQSNLPSSTLPCNTSRSLFSISVGFAL